MCKIDEVVEKLVRDARVIAQDLEKLSGGLGTGTDRVAFGCVLLENVGELGVERHRLGLRIELIEFAEGFFPWRSGFDDPAEFEKIDERDNEDSEERPTPFFPVGCGLGIARNEFFWFVLGEKGVRVAWVLGDLLGNNNGERRECEVDRIGRDAFCCLDRKACGETFESLGVSCDKGDAQSPGANS